MYGMEGWTSDNAEKAHIAITHFPTLKDTDLQENPWDIVIPSEPDGPNSGVLLMD